MQITPANTQTCKEFNCTIISTIQNTIMGWSDEFQNIFLKKN